MKSFHCDNCGMLVFFENDHCEKCGEQLGFHPGPLEMVSEKQWNPQLSSSADASTHTCANREHHVCNWLVAGEPDEPFCQACRLNETIPDLNVEGNLARWWQLELAKRRCLYTYLRLRLPLSVRPGEGRAPMKFRFLADSPGAPVMTGHENGLITLNIAEADNDECERRRLKFREPYRTLVGHFRHETGHYYWDRLIADSDRLPAFRKMFGDETLDYAGAMDRYYQEGPAGDWQQRTITPYASWHPWEDWAETWAHYLHIISTMDTAATFGLGLNRGGSGTAKNPTDRGALDDHDFDKLFNDWQPLILALNSINREMGLADLYPFVISGGVVEKLRFVHDVIGAVAVVSG